MGTLGGVPDAPGAPIPLLSDDLVDALDLEAYSRPIEEIASYLQGDLGQRMTAYLAGLGDASRSDDIRLTVRTPRRAIDRRLREGYKVVWMIEQLYDGNTAQVPGSSERTAGWTTSRRSSDLSRPEGSEDFRPVDARGPTERQYRRVRVTDGPSGGSGTHTRRSTTTRARRIQPPSTPIALRIVLLLTREGETEWEWWWHDYRTELPRSQRLVGAHGSDRRPRATRTVAAAWRRRERSGRGAARVDLPAEDLDLRCRHARAWSSATRALAG